MAKKQTFTSPIIKLKDWRASFLQLASPKSFQPGQTARYEGSFLADPTRTDHKAQILQLVEAAKELCRLKEWEYPKPGEEHLSDVQLCFGRADKHPKKKKYDGYAGMFYIVMANETPPTVCGRNLEPLDPKKKPYPYSGCRSNTNPTLWTQDNEFGKAIRANLRIVQFVNDDTPFGNGGAGPAPEDEFEPLGELQKTGKSGAAEMDQDDIPF